MTLKCEHCDVTEANCDLQDLLKEAEKRIAEHDRVIKELEKKVIAAIPKERYIKDNPDVDDLGDMRYNEAIAEITQSIKAAFGGGK